VCAQVQDQFRLSSVTICVIRGCGHAKAYLRLLLIQRQLDQKYYREAERFARQLVAHGWGLVYGGGNRGVMGVVGRTVKEAGGHVVGIIPEFMKTRELALDAANELVTVSDDARAKTTGLEERADGFVTLPGGIGTLEEFTEVMTLRY